MKEGFRQSMAWLHTWTGLLAGWILFLVFCTGTASYYKDEITLWMKPEVHQSMAHQVPQAQATASAVAFLEQRAPKSDRWFITLPSEREPTLRAMWAPPPADPAKQGEARPRRARFGNATLDPSTGEEQSAARATRGGEFLYRMHFDLHYMPVLWSRWIVGICAMFMLVAILSGIVTHKRIFKDFFTFRPAKGQRSWLDAHNVSAVLALPYHLMITYTGIVTLMFMYMPWGVKAVYQDERDKFFTELRQTVETDAKASRVPASLTPLQPLLAQATDAWGEAGVGRIVINHPKQTNASVAFYRRDSGSISTDQPSMVFNGVTGALVSPPEQTAAPAAQTQGVMIGLHAARFSSPALRALFFVAGLAGCAMVGTGLILWAVKERQKHAKVLAKGGRVSFGLRLVDGLNLGTIAGVPIALASYFWANRLLPVELADRPAMEAAMFFTGWGIAAVLALAWPARRMWQVLLGVGGVMFAGLPVLNAFTTDSHLGYSLAHGLTQIASFDIVVLLLGALLLFAAKRMGTARGKNKPTATHKTTVPRESKESTAPETVMATGGAA
jgi:uncharacterized iron-regulated membrane protein